MLRIYFYIQYSCFSFVLGSDSKHSNFSSCLRVCLLLTLSLGWIQATPRPDEHVRSTDKPRYWFAKKLSDSTEQPQDRYHLPIIPSPLLAVTEDVTRLDHLDWTLRSRSKRGSIFDSPVASTTEALPKCNPPEVYNKIHKRCQRPVNRRENPKHSYKFAS